MDYNPCHFGRGRVHIGTPLRPEEPNGGVWPLPGRFVGNARAFEIQPRVTQANTTAFDTRSNQILLGMTLRLELYGHGGENLAAALSGPRVQVVGNQQVDRVAVSRISLAAESMVFTRYVIDPTRPILVQPSWTIWTEGEHWERHPYGIRLLRGTSCPTGAEIALSYTSEGSGEEVDAGSYSPPELGIVYVGVNRMNGLPTRVDCYRCRLSLATSVPFISESVNLIALDVNLLPVRTQPAITRWFRTMRAPHLSQCHVE